MSRIDSVVMQGNTLKNLAIELPRFSRLFSSSFLSFHQADAPAFAACLAYIYPTPAAKPGDFGVHQLRRRRGATKGDNDVLLPGHCAKILRRWVVGQTKIHMWVGDDISSCFASAALSISFLALGLWPKRWQPLDLLNVSLRRTCYFAAGCRKLSLQQATR